MERETQENEKLRNVIHEMHISLQKLQQERNCLINEIQELSSTCDKLVNGIV